MTLAFTYAEEYNLDLGPHVFPAIKFGHVRRRLSKDGRFRKHPFVKPVPATPEEIQLVHSRAYFRDLTGLQLTPRLHRSELPLNEAVVSAFFLATGGTISATRQAVEYGRGINLGGGFHHAFRDQAEGFCYINDIAVAVRVLQKEKRIKKALVVDLDVHHGNGTAKIFSWDRSVYTFSMHEENNYPKIKPRGSLDIGLKTGTRDEEYLELLSGGLEKIRASFQPDLILYVAGVDIYENDRLGGLLITVEGIRERDRLVRDFLPGVPLVTVLAGGYAMDDNDTVDLHFSTCEVMAGLR